MLDDESLDSGKSTPRFLESPSTDSLTGKSSPLVVAQYHSSDDQIHRTGEGSPDSNTDQRIESEIKEIGNHSLHLPSHSTQARTQNSQLK